MLIAKFKFSPSNKEIFWQMSAIVTPSVKDGDNLKGPLMPLVVSRVEA